MNKMENVTMNNSKNGEVKASFKSSGILKYRNPKKYKSTKGILGYYLHNAQKVTSYSIEEEMDSMLMDRVKICIVDKITGKDIFNKTGVLTKQQVNGHYNFFVNDINLGNTLLNCIGKNIEIEMRSTKVCVSPEEDKYLAMAFRESIDTESEVVLDGAV